MENWFELIEKFKHVQTFQLIENENEWIVFSKEKRARKTENILQISSISWKV